MSQVEQDGISRDSIEKDDGESGMDCREDLLDAWIRMAAGVRGNRLLKSFSLNEMLVCNFLCRSGSSKGEITATEIGHRLRLLKSQMNKILTELEERGIVERYRSGNDRRKVYIRLTGEGRVSYLKEHDRVLMIFDSIRDSLGDENTCRLASLLLRATEAVDRYVDGIL